MDIAEYPVHKLRRNQIQRAIFEQFQRPHVVHGNVAVVACTLRRWPYIIRSIRRRVRRDPASMAQVAG